MLRPRPSLAPVRAAAVPPPPWHGGHRPQHRAPQRLPGPLPQPCCDRGMGSRTGPSRHCRAHRASYLALSARQSPASWGRPHLRVLTSRSRTSRHGNRDKHSQGHMWVQVQANRSDPRLLIWKLFSPVGSQTDQDPNQNPRAQQTSQKPLRPTLLLVPCVTMVEPEGRKRKPLCPYMA